MAKSSRGKGNSKKGGERLSGVLARAPKMGISTARAPGSFASGDPGKFMKILIKGGHFKTGVVRVPQNSYGHAELPSGNVLSTWRAGSAVSPKAERKAGGFDMDIISGPPDSNLIPGHRGFNSRHHVFEIEGKEVAMKIYTPMDETFGPKFAEMEAHNLTFFQHGLMVPTAEPVRFDVSAKFDKKKGKWVPTHEWARLFTLMPKGYVSINRLDFKQMSNRRRGDLLEELGYGLANMHRMRGYHGDPTLANILIRHPTWKMNQLHPENIKFIDAESFGYAGETPAREDILKTFAQDVRTLRADAIRHGMVTREDANELFKKHFWEAYMARWKGPKKSRIYNQIKKIGPEPFLEDLVTDERTVRPIAAYTQEEIADSMMDAYYKRIGL